MLYDRPYMKSEFEPRRLGFLAWFAIVCGVLFVVEAIVSVSFPGNSQGILDQRGREIPAIQLFIQEWFALSTVNLSEFKVWTAFTYSLFHGGPIHIIFNLLVIVLIGRSLEPTIGEKKVLITLVSGILIGALAFVGTGYLIDSRSPVVGASAGAMALIAVLCLTNYERPLTFLLFFIIPVTLKAKWILWGLIIWDGVQFLSVELQGGGSAFAVAHSAHLGGVLAGFGIFKFVLNSDIPNPFAGLFKKRTPATSGPNSTHAEVVNAPKPSRFKYRPEQQTVNLTKRNDVQKEVDRILDKINTQGFGALNESEKATLERARDLLSR